jgi:serine/threonine protein kinase
VAVKKIVMGVKREKRNLRILKRSLSSHRSILLHHAVLEHQNHTYVIMPYARLGDLWQFMNDGNPPGHPQTYDFAERFPKITSGNLAYAIIRQMVNLADALNWFHHEIKPEGSEHRLSCCHLDLKPDNILIDMYEGSLVGFWKISDFGLSVMNEQQKADPAVVQLGTVRDVVSQRSVNTMPKRKQGTYTAPEVKLGNIRREKIAGSRGDVWSFACILAELLAFSFGRSAEVERFFREREKGYKNDCFYTEKPQKPDALEVSHNTNLANFEVRKAVIDWLEDASRRATPQNWAGCWARTVKTLLDIDSSTRANSRELEILVRHIAEHVKDCLQGPLIHCTPSDERLRDLRQSTRHANVRNNIENPTLGHRVTRPLSPELPQAMAGVSIVVTDDKSRQPSDSLLRYPSEPVNPGRPVRPRTLSLPGRRIDSTQAGNSERGSAQIEAVWPFLPILTETGSPSPENQYLRRRSGEPRHGSLTEILPHDAHGILIHPKARREKTGSKLSKIKHNAQAVAVSSIKDGVLAAFLVKNEIYVHRIPFSAREWSQDEPIKLQESVQWKYVAIGGHYLAVWGCNTPGSMMVNSVIFLMKLLIF